MMLAHCVVPPAASAEPAEGERNQNPEDRMATGQGQDEEDSQDHEGDRDPRPRRATVSRVVRPGRWWKLAERRAQLAGRLRMHDLIETRFEFVERQAPCAGMAPQLVDDVLPFGVRDAEIAGG